MKLSLLGLAAAIAVASACTSTETHKTVETQTVATYDTHYSGPKFTLAIGQFANASPYMRGVFSDGDRLGGQARTILKTHLSQTGRFVLVDRDNLSEIARESQISGQEQQLIGAEIVLSGEVTEFGRKNVGDKLLFGIGGRGRKQIAYSKVSINVVDVRTSQVVYSIQGAGEYQLASREVLGTGSDAGYDATLNDKVLNLSITDAVNKLVEALERGEWGPAQ